MIYDTIRLLLTAYDHTPLVLVLEAGSSSSSSSSSSATHGWQQAARAATRKQLVCAHAYQRTMRVHHHRRHEIVYYSILYTIHLNRILVTMNNEQLYSFTVYRYGKLNSNSLNCLKFLKLKSRHDCLIFKI
jgi:hypothetical protein